MKIMISALALFFGLAMVGVEAEAAKRLGGGKSMGMQRNTTQQAAPKAPAQQQQQAQHQADMAAILAAINPQAPPQQPPQQGQPAQPQPPRAFRLVRLLSFRLL